ncbi:MAG TPA: hypothetical protein VEH79_00400 [Gaiellaceae bacterium]|nr:hypothetical protein [Gaiellaceae bacterium]
MRNPVRLKPVTFLALLALFFALGGSAVAVGVKVTPQPRCAQGAIRGIAAVVGDPLKGIANMPDQFSTANNLFARKFNCTGGAVQVRRVDTGIYEIKFVGNPAPNAIANAIAEDGSSAAINRLPDGTFRVSTRGATTNAGQFVLTDKAFVVLTF